MNQVKHTIIILLGIISFGYGQDLKPVKTGQDVIDNYMEVNGGADNLRGVKSIKMYGSLSIMNAEVKLTAYMSKDVFYLSTDSPDIKLIQAYDAKKNTGWTAFGGGIKDMDDAELARQKKTIAAGLWVYYYDSKKYGVTYDLLQDDKSDSVDCYVVEFKKGTEALETVYFDKKNFMRLKTITPEDITTLSDYKRTGELNINMPYKFTTPEREMKLTKYEFNQDFDKKLLEKPKDK